MSWLPWEGTTPWESWIHGPKKTWQPSEIIILLRETANFEVHLWIDHPSVATRLHRAAGGFPGPQFTGTCDYSKVVVAQILALAQLERIPYGAWPKVAISKDEPVNRHLLWRIQEPLAFRTTVAICHRTHVAKARGRVALKRGGVPSRRAQKPRAGSDGALHRPLVGGTWQDLPLEQLDQRPTNS